jgi:hypothetical protein
MEAWSGSGATVACQAANGYAANHEAEVVEPLNQFGYTGPLFSALDICPL